MTVASALATRPTRVAAAFVVLLSALVIIPGGQPAEAAGTGLEVTKNVDHNTISPGATSLWSLDVATDPDIVLANAITLEDTVPDGLCPLGAGDPDCPGGPAPSAAFSSAVENSDGSWTLRWDLADMGASETLTITYATVARSHYQEGFADDTPVLARDSWNNLAHVAGTVDGLPVDDYASAGQSAGSIAIANDVALRPATLTGPAVCGDGSALSWDPVAATGYRVGDQVCWRIAVDFPNDVPTLGVSLTNVLPPGQVFTANDVWTAGAGNTVPIADIDGSGNGTGDTTLTWTIGDGGGLVAADAYLDLVFSSTIVNPDATDSGQTVQNTVDASHTNTAGGTFTASESARVEVVEPELYVVKGVLEVNGVSTGGSNDVDGAQVKQADVVTYQITVTNAGDLDAVDVEVWDLLPDEYAVCSTTVATISDGGVCSDPENRIEWSGAAALNVPAGFAVTRTYEVVVPGGIAPGQTMSNSSGVRSFAAAVNNDSRNYNLLYL